MVCEISAGVMLIKTEEVMQDRGQSFYWIIYMYWHSPNSRDQRYDKAETMMINICSYPWKGELSDIVWQNCCKTIETFITWRMLDILQGNKHPGNIFHTFRSYDMWIWEKKNSDLREQEIKCSQGISFNSH